MAAASCWAWSQSWLEVNQVAVMNANNRPGAVCRKRCALGRTAARSRPTVEFVQSPSRSDSIELVQGTRQWRKFHHRCGWGIYSKGLFRHARRARRERGLSESVRREPRPAHMRERFRLGTKKRVLKRADGRQGATSGRLRWLTRRPRTRPEGWSRRRTPAATAAAIAHLGRIRRLRQRWPH